MVFALVIVLCSMAPAVAYVDPGTTGLLSQMAYLIFYGILATFGLFFRPIKNAWNRIFKPRKRPDSGPAEPDTTAAG